MNLNSKSIGYGYSCVRGEHHIALNHPNQDAVLAEHNKYGFIFAVADGVGSQPHSQIGSHSAVTAVRDTFVGFERRIIPVSNITKTIFEKYKEGVPEKLRSQASTTCVFAYLSNSSGLYLGQIGDGACYFKLNGSFSKLTEKNDDFVNLVHPLNASAAETKWKTRHFNVGKEDSVRLLLATDGVSADIVPGREENCLDYYCYMLARWPKILRNIRIRRCLKCWNVPGSNDDKTMIVFWRG